MAINMTDKEVQMLKGLITAQVEGALNTRLRATEAKIDGMEVCVSSLVRAIRGDAENKEIGILDEHKEMYKAFLRGKILLENLPIIVSVNVVSLVVQIVTALLNSKS